MNYFRWNHWLSAPTEYLFKLDQSFSFFIWIFNFLISLKHDCSQFPWCNVFLVVFFAFITKSWGRRIPDMGLFLGDLQTAPQTPQCWIVQLSDVARALLSSSHWRPFILITIGTSGLTSEPRGASEPVPSCSEWALAVFWMQWRLLSV